MKHGRTEEQYNEVILNLKEKKMIKFSSLASSAMLLALATFTGPNLLAQDQCATFDFQNESGEITFLADIDQCGTVVSWEEPILTNECDIELTIVTNYEQGQFLETGYYLLTYQAFDGMENLVGQSEIYLDVFDDKVPVPQGEDITQENPIEFPQYFDGPAVYSEDDFSMDLLPTYTAIDNCAGEVQGEISVVELEEDTRSVTWEFSDGVFTSELNILVYSNYDFTNSIDENGSFADSNAKIGMSVYPNPIEDRATVKLDSQSSEVYEVTVYSMTGKIVISEEFSNGENLLDVQFLPSGMYTILVKNDTTSSAERFIKK